MPIPPLLFPTETTWFKFMHTIGIYMVKLPPDYLIHKVESHYMQDFDRKSRLGNLTSVVAS